MSPENWWQYIDGYKEAGNLLLKEVQEGGRQNILIYPTVFAYRQYIELQLKEIVVNNRRYLDIYEDFPNIHNIDKLWAILREDLQRIDKDADPGFTKTEDYQEILKKYDLLEVDLKRFAEWDPDSTRFRYPVDSRGLPIVVDLKDINLKELSDLIESISNTLDAISAGAYEFLSQKERALSEGY